MAQITLRQRETELCKASKELELEKAAFLLEKADMQREKDEFQREKNGFAAATNENILEAKRKKEAEQQRQSKETWEVTAKFAAIFLFIPAFSLGATLLVAEAVGGWRMFIWAIAAAAGNGQGR